MNTSDDWFIQGVVIRQGADENIVKIIEETTVPAVPAGTNYLSLVSRTMITVMKQSGRKDKIKLIVKRLPTEKGKAEFVEQSRVFKIEIKIYSHFLKSMEDLMTEADDTDTRLWGEMIGYHPNDCIIFEDLNAQGFKMTKSRHEYLDFDHTLVVIQALGRFHALSKVLLKTRLASRTDLPPHQFIDNPKRTAMFLGHCLKIFGSLIMNWGPEWKEVGNKFTDYSRSLHEKVVEVGHVSDDSKLLVLNHGDLWTCNFLFKYARYSNKPIDVRLVDFQLSHFNTLGWDLIYLLCGCVDPEIRRNHYDILLEVYLHEMKTTAFRYGLLAEDIPALSEIKADIVRLLPLRIISTTFFRPFFMSRYMTDFDAIMRNESGDDSIGQNPKSISDPIYKDHSEMDLKKLASEI